MIIVGQSLAFLRNKIHCRFPKTRVYLCGGGEKSLVNIEGKLRSARSEYNGRDIVKASGLVGLKQVKVFSHTANEYADE